MANQNKYYFKPEQESLKPITTIYTVCDYGNSYGLEAHHFYHDEEQAIKVCLNEQKELTMIRKIEVFDYNGPRGEYKVIKESTYSEFGYINDRFWRAEENGFLLAKNNTWSDIRIREQKKRYISSLVGHMPIYFALLTLGIEIIDEADFIFFIADNEVYSYDFSTGRYLSYNCLTKNTYRAYAYYMNKFGIWRMLHFVSDYAINKNFYCTLNEQGEIILINDDGTVSCEEYQETKWGITKETIKKTYRACFLDGEFLKIQPAIVKIHTLTTKNESPEGQVLPKDASPLQ